MTQSAAQGGIDSPLLGQPTGNCQGLQLLLPGELRHGCGFEQIPLAKAAAETGQRWWSLLLPALQVIPGADVVVGQKTVEVEFFGVPQPALHHAISPDEVRTQLPGQAHKPFQQPVAHHVQAMVVHAAVHQVAHHQVVLNGHQALWMNG